MKKQKCKKGFRWCPIRKRCVPEDQVKGQGQRQARGKGEGPMGQPRRIDEAIELVDVILNGDYKSYKVIKDSVDLIDKLVDEVENKLDNVPDQNMETLYKTVFDELSTDSMTPVEERMAESIKLLISEEEYREFFKKMLNKWNISSPSELSDEKKKEFFDQVDKEWKGKKETD
jgi:Mg/Co/Ni transporter MgtE